MRNLPLLETLDALGRRYGRKPSEFLEGLHPFQAVALDLRSADAGALRQKRELKLRENRGR